METKLTPTEGNWHISEDLGLECVVKADKVRICDVKSFGKDMAFNDATVIERRANAAIIVDAGNAFQKCHLLPSQLLQQRDELMEASKDMITLWEKLFESFPMLKNEPKYLKAQQLIQKHQI